MRHGMMVFMIYILYRRGDVVYDETRQTNYQVFFITPPPRSQSPLRARKAGIMKIKTSISASNCTRLERPALQSVVGPAPYTAPFVIRPSAYTQAYCQT